MIPNSAHNQDLAPDDVLSGVSLNYEWRQLVVPILYDGLFRYLNDITNEIERQTYIARVDALIDDIYTPEVTMLKDFHAVARITTQAIGAGTPTLVQWSTGSDYDAANPTRLATGAGTNTITANVHFSSASASVGHVAIKKNGAILQMQTLDGLATNYVSIAAIDVSDNDDYYELEILSNQASTLQVSTFTPNMKAVRLYE